MKEDVIKLAQHAEMHKASMPSDGLQSMLKPGVGCDVHVAIEGKDNALCFALFAADKVEKEKSYYSGCAQTWISHLGGLDNAQKYAAALEDCAMRIAAYEVELRYALQPITAHEKKWWLMFSWLQNPFLIVVERLLHPTEYDSDSDSD